MRFFEANSHFHSQCRSMPPSIFILPDVLAKTCWRKASKVLPSASELLALQWPHFTLNYLLVPFKFIDFTNPAGGPRDISVLWEEGARVCPKCRPPPARRYTKLYFLLQIKPRMSAYVWANLILFYWLYYHRCIFPRQTDYV